MKITSMKYTNINIKEVQKLLKFTKINWHQFFHSCENCKRGGTEVLLEIHISVMGFLNINDKVTRVKLYMDI